MKHVVIVCIRIYQRLVSPGLPNCCIYSPSCSEYAAQAYQHHGFWRASWLTLRRLARCGPWGAGGEDPIRH